MTATDIIMQDSTTPSRIPLNATAVAGYANGDTAWDTTVFTKYANLHVPFRVIDVLAAGVGDTLDVETGDATPGDIGTWLKNVSGDQERLRGMLPAIYMNASTYLSGGGRTALLDAKVTCVLWIADWTNAPHIWSDPDDPTDISDATQYETDHALNIDYSLCRPSFFAATPPPPAAPPTTPTAPTAPTITTTPPTQEIHMTVLNAPIIDIVLRPQDDGYWLIGQDGGIFEFGGAVPLTNPEQGKLGAGQVIEAAVSSPSGAGLYLTGRDGGVYALGDAKFYGSIPGDSIGPSTSPIE